MLSAIIESKARGIARDAARLAALGLCAAIGVGFLTAAGWHALADALSPVWAHLLVGATFVVIAALLHFWPKPQQAQPKPTVTSNDLVTVFLSGMRTGQRLR